MACYDQQDRNNPLKSGFIMSDQMMTVEQLIFLRLSKTTFACLSASEIAKGDERQPDPAVHLAATMLFAGVKSVIGTMW